MGCEVNEKRIPNPNGRPLGKGAVALARIEFRQEGKLKKLINKLYEQAIGGDVAAARTLLERIAPAYRAHSAPVRVALPPAGSLTDQAKALLLAAASGELSTDQASELITAISRVVTVEQGDEFRRRLDELERGDIA
jgi:hypothetical protein